MIKPRFTHALFTLFICIIANFNPLQAINPKEIPLLGVGAGGIAYYTQPFFRNAVLLEDRGWMLRSQPNQKYFNWAPGQVDANGYPQYLLSGQTFFIQPGQNMNYGPPNNAVIQRNKLFEGLVCLTWEGDADIRIVSAGSGFTFVSSLSGGNPSTGRIVNGRRFYFSGSNPNGYTIEIFSINSVVGIQNIQAWMPNPQSPNTQTLEPTGDQTLAENIFHPEYLRIIQPFKLVRFMDWCATNASPVQDWSDRRPANHTSAEGVINRRSPTPGYSYNVGWANRNITIVGAPVPVVTVTDIGFQLNQTVTAYFLTPHTGGRTVFARTINSSIDIGGGLFAVNYTNYLEEYGGDRGTGVPYEFMVALCNAQNKDIWINVPHLATNDFITKLAQLIKYGSDGVNPYTSPQANPVWKPLKKDLKIYIEYSNEIWSNGNAFAQGEWAEKQGRLMGFTTNPKARFNARRFVEVFDIFQQVFGPENNIVNVAAAFTGNPNYTEPYLVEMTTFGQNFTTRVKPDVLAVTTYFSCRIEDWADKQGPAFFNDLSEANVNRTIDEFKRRMLSFEFGAGSFDANDIGGFGVNNRNLARRFGLPIVSYEGGPSIYTDSYDFPGNGKENLTNLMCAMNRHSRFADIYNIHLNQARSIGLRLHNAFVDVSTWSKWGQWGHMEAFHQVISTATGTAVKMKFLFDFQDENQFINHIDDSIGTRPKIVTDAQLPLAKENAFYDFTISFTGGDGIISKKLISAIEAPGVDFDVNNLRFRGTPTQAGLYYYFVRITDSDGDPDYRTFTLRVLPSPKNALFAWDNFGNVSTQLHGLNSGMVSTVTGTIAGFSNAWEVQGSSNVFTVVGFSGTSTGFGSLLSTTTIVGMAGGTFLTAGRSLRVSDYDYLIKSGDNSVIGQPQTAFWTSMLVNRISDADPSWVINFRQGGFYIIHGTYKFRIGVNTSNRNWQLEVRDNLSATSCSGTGCTQVQSSKRAKVNEWELIVCKVAFGVTNDTISVFINPTCVGSSLEPTNPDIVHITNGSVKMDFNAISLYGSTQRDRVLVDDIRFGDTYRAVTPSTDNVAPSAPTLTLNATLPTAAAISWTQSTDNIAVAAYDVLVNGNLSARIPASQLSFTITGLTPSTSHLISVLARDCADNSSALSNVLTVNMAIDNVPPSNPTGLQANNIAGNSVGLSWVASTDNVAISHYVIHQNSVPIITVTQTNFNVGNLLSNTTYTFFIKAYDLAGNASVGNSNVLTVTTLDIVAPTIPQGLSATTLTGNRLALSWLPSTDNVGVAYYTILLNNVTQFTTTGTAFTVTGLTQNANNFLRLRATDVNGNGSFFSTVIGVFMPLFDEIFPVFTPGIVSVTGIGNNQFIVSWPVATDNIGILNYLIQSQNQSNMSLLNLGTTNALVFTTSSLVGPANYRFIVNARDFALNTVTLASGIISALDITPPTVPAGVAVALSGSNQISINWGASSDNVAVSYYEVSVSGIGLFTVNGISTVQTVSTVGMYQVKVRAVDSSNNKSDFSTVSTIEVPDFDVEPPVFVGEVEVEDLQQNFFIATWNAATDNRGIAYYSVYAVSSTAGTRLLSTLTGTSLIINTLRPYKTYQIVVYVHDIFNNTAMGISGAFNTVDITPPTTPTILGITLPTINPTFTWTASTDSLSGLKEYRIFRNNQFIGVTTTTAYTIPSLTLGVGTHNFQVSAIDNVGNESPKSAAIAWTVSPTQATNASKAYFECLPNPTSGLLTIKTSLTEHVQINVYSMIGTKLLEFNASEPNTTIDISNLENGLYVIEVLKFNGDRIGLKKIVKQ